MPAIFDWLRLGPDGLLRRLFIGELGSGPSSQVNPKESHHDQVLS